jgi:predicted component of type VI protein secretion system
MARLSPFIQISLMSGPRDGDVLPFDLSEDGTLKLTLGRRDQCDIPLSYDNQVSRLHAELVYDGSQFWLEDLSSRNGTFLHNKPVAGRVLLPIGTLFRVGRTWLRLDVPVVDHDQIFTASADDGDDLF